MLRSYQYTNKSYLSYSMQSDIFQRKEIEFVKAFADTHVQHIRPQRGCPMCEASETKLFFEKWGMPYYRCDDCHSVYALCTEEEEKEYLRFEELIRFRLSRKYQEQMTENRASSWKEYLEWLEVRAFRFLGKNRGLKIIDYGNRLYGFTEMIANAKICGNYELRDSVLPCKGQQNLTDRADVVLYNDSIKTEFDPKHKIEELKSSIAPDGILIIGARAGSGFDVLTLKDHNSRIVPYEHILLPSVKGMTEFLEHNGFEILEITTPGVMDVKYVMDCLDEMDERETFVRHLLSEGSEPVLQEFQRFLQKSCMSSLIRVIARVSSPDEMRDYR